MLRALEQGDGTLPNAEVRWRRLLLDGDPAVRLSAEKFIYEQAHGRARPWEEPPAGPVSIVVDISRDGAVVDATATDSDAASPAEPEVGGGRWEIT
jgi:hypothetical protein